MGFDTSRLGDSDTPRVRNANAWLMSFRSRGGDVLSEQSLTLSLSSKPSCQTISHHPVSAQRACSSHLKLDVEGQAAARCEVGQRLGVLESAWRGLGFVAMEEESFRE